MTPDPAAVAAGHWLLYREEPFTLHSGDKSHFLIDADALFACEPLREVVLDYWEVALKPYRDPLHFIGIPQGGLRWAEAIAARLDSTWGPLEASPHPSLKVVVDDVVTTGASIRALGYRTTLCVVRRNPDAEVSLPWATIPLP